MHGLQLPCWQFMLVEVPAAALYHVNHKMQLKFAVLYFGTSVDYGCCNVVIQ